MTFTPLDLMALGVLASYYCIKWFRNKKKDSWKGYDDFNLCHERHRTDNNINTKAKVVARTPQGVVYDRPGLRSVWDEVLTGHIHNQATQLGMFGSAAQAQQESQIQRILSGQEKLYPGKVIFVDPAEVIFDDAYWRAWKRKHKHEEDPG